MNNETDGISIRIFIAGIIITILVSSGLSVVINTQLDEGSQELVGGFSAPDYDSGWQSEWSQDAFGTRSMSPTHNLGTTKIFVYIIGRISESWIHQINYGFDSKNYSPSPGLVQEKYHGIFWRSTENIIEVTRGRDDTQWEEIRVLIWIIPEPSI